MLSRRIGPTGCFLGLGGMRGGCEDGGVSRAHRRGARVAPVAVLTVSIARAVTVEVDCSRLAQNEQEELRARARLTSAARLGPATPGEIVFRCDSTGAWWDSSVHDMSRVVVHEREDLVEAALEALERSFAQSSPPVEHDTEGDLAPRGEPELPPPEQFASDREGYAPSPGGLGVSLSSEPRPGSVAVGPGFELGVGSGDWVGAVSESVRWGSRESTLLWDARLGLGWGAPFVPNRSVGLLAAVGLQGLSVVGRDPGPRGDANGLAPIAALGLRGALHWSRAAFWAGLDGGYRLQPLEVAAPFDLSLPRTFLTLTIGVLMLADAGEPTSTHMESSRPRSDIAIMWRSGDRTHVSALPAFAEPVCTRNRR
jgi:hypothetical protein